MVIIKDSLQLKIVNHKSEIIDDLLGYEGTPVIGIVEEENSEYKITTYKFSIKPFIDLKFIDNKPENLFLIISPPNYSSSIDRYIFEGEHAINDKKIKLEITYAIYNEN